MTHDFDIRFLDERGTDEGVAYRYLRLQLGSFAEEMCADLVEWREADYEEQWLRELVAIASTREKAALITSITNPQQACQVWTWPMWKDGDEVRFHNRILFMEEVCEGFDPSRVSDFIGEYKSHDEDGNKISEWSVRVDAIRNFVESRQTR